MLDPLLRPNPRFYYWADWPLFFATLPLVVAGLVTMNSFTGPSLFFDRQILWVALGILVFFLASFVNWRFLGKTWASLVLFLISIFVLGALLLAGEATKGAVGWFDFGSFSLQPSDPIKIFLIIILAK